MNIANIDRNFNLSSFKNEKNNVIPSGTVSLGKGSGRKVLNQDPTQKEGSVYSAGNPMKAKQKDDQLSGLMSQLSKIQEQMYGLQDRENLTPEQKIEMKKQLQQQMAEVQQMIAARQMEMQEAEKEKQEQELKKAIDESMPEAQKEEEPVFDAAGMESITAAANHFDETKVLQKVKTKLEGEIGVQQAELKSSAASGGAVEGKIAAIHASETSVSALEKKIAKKVGTILEDVKESIETSAEDAKDNKEVEEDTVLEVGAKPGVETEPGMEAKPAAEAKPGMGAKPAAEAKQAVIPSIDQNQVIPAGVRPQAHINLEV